MSPDAIQPLRSERHDFPDSTLGAPEPGELERAARAYLKAFLRRSPDGEYYQVCLLCAAAYQYDWKTMRRGDRVEHPAPESTAVRRRSGQKQPTWVPRARRLKLNLPIRYRVKNLSSWYEGSIRNISQSGVMFVGLQIGVGNAL